MQMCGKGISVFYLMLFFFTRNRLMTRKSPKYLEFELRTFINTIIIKHKKQKQKTTLTD